MSVAISTSWNHTPATDMRQWVAQVKDLGFTALELGYTLSASQLKQLTEALRSTDIRVNSIHNFCPIPDDELSTRHPSNYYRLSSLNRHERQKAVEWTNKTIDLAVKVGAGVVIIHAGTLELKDDPSGKLIELYNQGKRETSEFDEQKKILQNRRQENKQPFIDALKDSLEQVMAHARMKEIMIGLETRYYPIEIPNFEEIGYFLDLFAGEGMGYWHDVGHAEVSGRLGLAPHRDFLSAYQEHLIGMHIHGIKGLRDHLAPFDGDMDLKSALSFVKPNALKVIESRFATPEQIKEALLKLSFSL